MIPGETEVLSLFPKLLGCDDKMFVGLGLAVLELAKILEVWIGVVIGLLLSPTVSLKSFFGVC